jgi:hypothetical protein
MTSKITRESLKGLTLDELKEAHRLLEDEIDLRIFGRRVIY